MRDTVRDTAITDLGLSITVKRIQRLTSVVGTDLGREKQEALSGKWAGLYIINN